MSPVATVLHCVEPTFGQYLEQRGLPDHLDVEVVWQDFVLDEGQRQARRGTTDTRELAGSEPPVTTELARALAAAEVIVGQDLPLGITTLAPRLRWVQLLSSGVDHLAPCGLGSSAVTVTNGAGIAAVSVAEWVMAQCLSIYKRLPEHASQQAGRVWRATHGRRLAGRSMLIFGLGSIGAEVARLAAAFGVHVTGVRRSAGDGPVPTGVTEVVDPARGLSRLGGADIVVLCLPNSRETDGLFGARQFRAMKGDATFINVGRGSSVDEQALIHALSTGEIAAAAIDVAREEPLSSSNPLWATPNLHISPHSSVSFDGYLDGAYELLVENLTRHRQGDDLLNQVRRADLYGTPDRRA